MTNSDNSIIRVENICYSVNNKPILEDIDFCVPKGSFTSLVGMNGTGKTTLLKLISNAIKPTKGKIFLENEDINSYSVRQSAQNISMVFQSNDIDFDFSAIQIVMMGRMPYQRLLDSDKEEDFLICKQAMQRTNTWQLKDRMINTLSGGEKQRVFIARSLAQQTKVMLLDEPVANLDLKHQIEIMKLLKQIQKDNFVTIIIVLHDLSLALKYSDYTLALKNGRMQFFDSTEKVLTEENISSLFEITAKIADKNNVIITNN